MSEETESTPKKITITIRNGSDTEQVTVSETITIRDLCAVIAPLFNAVNDELKVIFAGKIMKDDETLMEHGVKDTFVVHLVIKRLTTPEPANNQPEAAEQIPFVGGSSFMSGLLSSLQDPESVRRTLNDFGDILRNPTVQNMFMDPERIRSVVTSNPQIRDLIERQPEIGHILNNPELFRQSFEIARNPAMMQELMRTQDRAMSNLESIPGGYNALQRMYRDIQEPMMDAATNPFNLFQSTSTESGSGSGSTQSTTNPQQGTENREPLPNPWDTSRQQPAPLLSFIRSQVPGTTTSDMFSTAMVPENVLRLARQMMGDMRSSSNASADFGAVRDDRRHPTATSGSGVIPSLSAAEIDFIAAQSGFSPSDDLPGAGAGSAANTTARPAMTESSNAPVNYEAAYREQLKKLEEMGFFNRQENLKVASDASASVNVFKPYTPSEDAFPVNVNISSDPPWIFMITPTYKRSEQLPELIRLSHTLLLVHHVHWIVVEDSNVENQLVIDYLNSIQPRLRNTYLLAPMPERFRNHQVKPRGVSNRIRALQWIQQHTNTGVIYFGDDDNTYDLSLFQEIRKTKYVSMFPVGLVTAYGLSTPIIKDGKFIDFYDGWRGGRKYPVDMAGFAVSVPFYLQTNATMPFKPGYEEDIFLQNLKFNMSQIQFLGDNCSKILAWHTQTKKNKPADKKLIKKYSNTNLNMLANIII